MKRHLSLTFFLLVQVTALVVLIGGCSSKFANMAAVVESACEFDGESQSDQIDSQPWLGTETTYELATADFSHSIIHRDCSALCGQHSRIHSRGPPIG